MEWSRGQEKHGAVPAEQYWPDVTRLRLRTALEGVFAGGGGTEVPGGVVAVLFTRDDECVFYLLDGESEAAAGVLVARTGRPADRVQRCERLDREALGSYGSWGRKALVTQGAWR